MPEGSPQTNRKSDYHDPRYEDQGNYDSYPSHMPDVGDNRVRFFVALFDYDPQTMSPNPDAADEELPFQEGQIIKVNHMYSCKRNKYSKCIGYNEKIKPRWDAYLCTGTVLGVFVF